MLQANGRCWFVCAWLLQQPCCHAAAFACEAACRVVRQVRMHGHRPCGNCCCMLAHPCFLCLILVSSTPPTPCLYFAALPVQVMFSQVESAFNAWLADSSKAVSAAQADAGASLNSTLTQLQSVVNSMRHDLGDTAKALSRLASSTANKAQAEPAAGAAAGAAGTPGRVSGSGAAAAPQDPRAEIAGLLSSRQYETALVKALNTADLDILLWTCQQVRAAGCWGLSCWAWGAKLVCNTCSGALCRVIFGSSCCCMTGQVGGLARAFGSQPRWRGW